jgi:hypothetical protein
MVLDTTIAGSAADSYLSVAEADARATADLGRHAREWLAATRDQKEAALRRATRDLDTFVGVVAAPYVSTQSLLFPRSVDVLGAAFVPEPVAQACYEQAAFLLRNADLIDDAASRRAQGLSSFANPDGTGGSLDTNYTGDIAPRARKLLGYVLDGAIVATIVSR